MKKFLSNKISQPKQYITSIALIFIAASVCYFLSGFIGYKVVAFILLVTVSLIAMFFDILPVLLSAVLSALVWNFFFIPPKFTFAIHNTEDVLLFFMYFIIASVNAVLTFKIRQIEKQASKKEEKENTLKLYNTLLNSLSHELRTPIATIIGATDNLQTDENKLSAGQKNELLAEISIASLRLNGQVENLLNMSRLESGVIQPKKDWCDVNELIYDVVNRLKENLDAKTIQVSIKENLPLFKLDIGLMEQVLHNLIYNALLYTPENSTIKITAECVHQHLILKIEDNGNGFPADEIYKVFDKFYRLSFSKAGGTGLGLSIVKGFVEAHHGKINLKNISSGGAIFNIEIPAEISYLNNLKNE